MTYARRIHGWLADHVSWVQYPDVRPSRPVARLSLFRNQMPAPTRVALVMFGVFALCAATAMLGAIALLVWAAVTA